MIGRRDGNTNGPVTSHTQIAAGRAKLALSIVVQRDRIGPHSHILHGGIQHNLYMGSRPIGMVVSHLGREQINARMVGCNVEGNCKSSVKGLHSSMERPGYCGGLWPRLLGG